MNTVIKSIHCVTKEGTGDYLRIGDSIDGFIVSAFKHWADEAGYGYKAVDKTGKIIREYCNCPVVVDYKND